MIEPWRGIVAAGVLLAGAAAATPAAAQLCNGLPFRSRGIVAASYLTGDAADSPYVLREYGASVARQLPGWSPFGTHQVVRAQGGVGRASFDTLTAATGPAHFAGNGGSVGVSYTVDVLPASVTGEYVLCLSGGLQGQWWHVAGLGAGGVAAPIWLSFGAPIRLGSLALFPHGSFGAYWRAVTGQAPDGPVRERGVRPWSDTGAGLMLGRARLDAVLRHELDTRERVVFSFGLEL